MARRSVSFDFLAGRNTVSGETDKIARDFDDLEDHADKAGRGAGKKFREGFGDGANDRGGFFKKLITPSEASFRGLKDPIISALSTPLGAGIAASLVNVLSVAIPAAVTAGLGVALVGLGAFALRGSTMLKRAFKSAGNVISESLRQAALPLRGPFLQAIETVTGAMLQLQPAFRGLFKGLKPAIQPLVDGFVGLARNALPGLQAALPGINTAFQAIGDRLPGLGRTVGNFFAAISENLPAIERGIDLLFTLTEVVLNVAGAFLTVTQKVSGAFANVGAFLSVVKEHTIGLHSGQQKAAQSGEQLANNQGHLAIMAQKNAARQADLTAKLREARQAFHQQRSAIASVIPVFEGYSAKSDITKNKILSNLRQEVNAYKNWASNAQALLRKGADPAVVKALSDKGPQYVAAFVNASGRELQQLNGLFKSRTQAAGSVAIATAGAAGAAMGRAAAAAFSANFRPVLAVPRVGTGGAGAFKGRRPKAFASGGVIQEPVFGVGLRTGTPHTFAEQGPETVIPHGRRRGGTVGGSVTINVHGVTDPRAVALKVRDELVRFQGRNGTTGLR